MTTFNWKVNEYLAAVCVSAEEISRKLKKVFEETDDLPKEWADQHKTAKPTQKPHWKISVTFGAPFVDFDSKLESGVRLRIPLEAGSFTHMNVETEMVGDKENTIITWPIISLVGTVLSIDTSMTAEHIAAPNTTVDEKFTVQSLYIDLQNPKLLTNIETSEGHPLTKADGTESSVAKLIYDHVKSDRYAKGFVVGTARIPKVAATTGDFAPAAVRYSRYQEPKGAAGGKARGCLNWNLAFKDEPLPPAGNDRAGRFPAYPIPDNAQGVLLISWGTVLRRIIAAKALSCFGLKESNFTFREAQANAGLNGHVGWKLYQTVSEDTKQVDGKFTEATIRPSLEHDGVLVDFKMEDVRQYPSRFETKMYSYREAMGSRSGAEIGSHNTPPMITAPHTLTWCAAFKFGIDGEGKLTLKYSIVSGPVSDDGASWLGRVAAGLLTFGLSEMIRIFQSEIIEGTIKRQFDPDAQFAELIKAVELPGRSVFKFNSVKATTDGLAFTLTYA